MNMDDIDFSYNGDDEETKRIATQPEKPKVNKVFPKKKEPKPILLPNKPIDVALPPTPVVLEEIITPTTQEQAPTIEKTTVQPTKEEQKITEINTPMAVVATVAVAASVAAFSSLFKAKTKLKGKSKTKLENKKTDNRSKEEKKEEEQKQCNSKSEKVQDLINEVNSVINNNFIEQVQIKEDKVLKDKMKALNLEMILINKKIKALEENANKKKTK